MQFPLTFTLALAAAGSAVIPLVFATPLKTVFPTATGNVTYSKEPKRLKANEVFDGGMMRYGRGLTPCDESDGPESGAVFILEAGATIKNAIIGADQYEGMYPPPTPSLPNLFLSLDTFVSLVCVLCVCG